MKKYIRLTLLLIFSVMLVACQKTEVSGIEVHFETNGGSEIELIKLSESSLIQAPLFPTKENNVFRGWYEDKELSIPWNFETNYITSKTTLYAKWVETSRDYQNSFKILSIGNSFSEDAHKYLWSIAKSSGIDEHNIHIANMYIGGSELFDHLANLKTNKAAYTLQSYTSETVTTTSSFRLENIITYDDWDVITFQQASHHSGLKEKYEEIIPFLTNWALKNAINPDVKIGWHQTWAYEQTSTHSGFQNYNKDQIKMFEMIQEATKVKVFSTLGMGLLIPSGTAIQNARTSYFGDTFTIDGYHLSQPFGRYIAGLTFFGAITSYNLDLVTYMPPNLTEEQKLVAFEAVKNALANPLEVTSSNYTKK